MKLSSFSSPLKRGFLFAFDSDLEAIKYSDQVLSEVSSNYKIFHSNFVNIQKTLSSEKIDSVDGILFDLGVSSPQIDNPSRGFSFMHDGKTSWIYTCKIYLVLW